MDIIKVNHPSFGQDGFIRNNKNQMDIAKVINLLEYVKEKSEKLIVRGVHCSDTSLIIQGLVNHAIEKTLYAVLTQFDCIVDNEAINGSIDTMMDIIKNDEFDISISESIINIINGVKIKNE